MQLGINSTLAPRIPSVPAGLALAAAALKTARAASDHSDTPCTSTLVFRSYNDVGIKKHGQSRADKHKTACTDWRQEGTLTLMLVQR